MRHPPFHFTAVKYGFVKKRTKQALPFAAKNSKLNKTENAEAWHNLLCNVFVLKMYNPVLPEG